MEKKVSVNEVYSLLYTIRDMIRHIDNIGDNQLYGWEKVRPEIRDLVLYLQDRMKDLKEV